MIRLNRMCTQWMSQVTSCCLTIKVQKTRGLKPQANSLRDKKYNNPEHILVEINILYSVRTCVLVPINQLQSLQSAYPAYCTVKHLPVSYNYINMKPTRWTLTEYSCTASVSELFLLNVFHWCISGYIFCTAALKWAIQTIHVTTQQDLPYLHPINPTIRFSSSFCLNISFVTGI